MAIPQYILNLLFILPLLLVGSVSSYSDIKYGKIKNRHILFGLVYILILYLFLFVYGWGVLRQVANVKYLGELLVNAVVAIVLGYILWFFNLWAAGDAKLFLIYALLIPLEFYAKDYISFFPSASLLIDTFFLICLFFLITILVKGAYLLLNHFKRHKLSFKDFKRSIFNHLNYKKINGRSIGGFILKLVKLPLIYVSFLIFLECLITKAPLILHNIMVKPLNIYLLFLGLQLLVFRPFSKNKHFVLAMIAFGTVGSIVLVLNHVNPLAIIFRPSVLFMMCFNVMIQFVYSYIEKHETITIVPTQLCTGMVLTAECIAQMKDRLKATDIDIIGSDGLDEPQIRKIYELCQNNPSITLCTYKTIPYAPFMFVAFLGTIVSHGSILSQFLRSLHLQN